MFRVKSSFWCSFAHSNLSSRIQKQAATYWVCKQISKLQILELNKSIWRIHCRGQSNNQVNPGMESILNLGSRIEYNVIKVYLFKLHTKYLRSRCYRTKCKNKWHLEQGHFCLQRNSFYFREKDFWSTFISYICLWKNKRPLGRG